MTQTDAQRRAATKYRKNHVKRVPLDMKTEDYVELQDAAAAVSEPVNTYIKKAIRMRIESEKAAGDES